MSASQTTGHELGILVIGDSNTEIGHITNGLNRVLQQVHGLCGMGYVCLHDKRTGALLPPLISITNDGGWAQMDMRDVERLPPPYPSPDGNWIEGRRPGAVATIVFDGPAIDVYWLSQPGGGSIACTVNGEAHTVITTHAAKREVQSTRLRELGNGRHTLTLTAEHLPVTLLGVDIIGECHGRRVICHKWGNAWSSTRDFLNIEDGILESGLRELDPAIVVILLGSNDHNLDGTGPEQFKSQLLALIRRVQTAQPGVRILLTSTYEGNSTPSRVMLPQYRATAYPQAARETGVAYWDMAAWFGPFDQRRMLDDGHCNEEAGHSIAVEMHAQLIHHWKHLFAATQDRASADSHPQSGAGRHMPPIGFSLVELLAMITILSVLAAMLLPSLERSLEMSHDVGCKNNLRQFAVSEAMYSEDYRGPATVYQLNTYYHNKVNFYKLMAWGGYAENPHPVIGNYYITPALGMWQCPSVSTYVGSNYEIAAMLADAEAAPLFEAEYAGYIPQGTCRFVAAFLSHYMPFLTTRYDSDSRMWDTWTYGRDYGAHSVYRYTKTSEMQQHSRVMLWTDATSWRDPAMAFQSRNPANFIYNRHDGHFNAAMWDGRVASVQYRDFKTFQANNPRMLADGYPVLKAPHALVLPSRTLKHIAASEYSTAYYNPATDNE